MLHIVGFITVCEAFLGIDPHVDLFCEVFVGRPVTLRWEAGASRSDTTIALIGSFRLQRKPGKASYPWYAPVDNNWGWHDEWFYIRQGGGIPGIHQERPGEAGQLDLGGLPEEE